MAPGEQYEWEVVYTDDSTLRSDVGDYADIDRMRIAHVRLWDGDVLVLDLTPDVGQAASDLVIRRRHKLGTDGHRMVWIIGFPDGPEGFVYRLDPLTHESDIITNDVVPLESETPRGATVVWGSTRDAYTAGTTQPLDGAVLDTTSLWVFADVYGIATSDIKSVSLFQVSPTEATLWTEGHSPYGDTIDPLSFTNGTSPVLFARITLLDDSTIDSPTATFSVESEVIDPTPRPPSDLIGLIKDDRAGLALARDTGYDAETWPEVEVTNLDSSGAGSLDAAINDVLNAGGHRTIVCTPGLSGIIPWARATADMPNDWVWSFRMGNIKVKSTQSNDMIHIHGSDNIVIDGVEIEGPTSGENDPIQIGHENQARSAGHTRGIFINRYRGSNASDEVFGITEPKSENTYVTIARTWLSNPKGMLISCDAGGGTDPAKAQKIHVDQFLVHYDRCVGANRNPKLKGVFGRLFYVFVEESEFGTQLMDANTGVGAAGHTILDSIFYKSTVDGGRGGVFSGSADIGDKGVYNHLLYVRNLHFRLSSSPNYHWGHGEPTFVTDLSQMWNGNVPPHPNDVLGLAATPDEGLIESTVKQYAGVWEGRG